MSTQYTPGPWKANKPTHSNGRAEVHAGPMLVAQAFNWMLDAEGDEQCWADARLIAAAPDLLQSCKAALEALEALQGGCTDSDDGTVEALTVWCPEVIDDLAAAIAKAEGA